MNNVECFVIYNCCHSMSNSMDFRLRLRLRTINIYMFIKLLLLLRKIQIAVGGRTIPMNQKFVRIQNGKQCQLIERWLSLVFVVCCLLSTTYKFDVEILLRIEYIIIHLSWICSLLVTSHRLCIHFVCSILILWFVIC